MRVPIPNSNLKDSIVSFFGQVTKEADINSIRGMSGLLNEIYPGLFKDISNLYSTNTKKNPRTYHSEDTALKLIEELLEFAYKGESPKRLSQTDPRVAEKIKSAISRQKYTNTHLYENIVSELIAYRDQILVRRDYELRGKGKGGRYFTDPGRAFAYRISEIETNLSVSDIEEIRGYYIGRRDFSPHISTYASLPRLSDRNIIDVQGEVCSALLVPIQKCEGRTTVLSQCAAMSQFRNGSIYHCFSEEEVIEVSARVSRNDTVIIDLPEVPIRLPRNLFSEGLPFCKIIVGCLVSELRDWCKKFPRSSYTIMKTGRIKRSEISKLVKLIHHVGAMPEGQSEQKTNILLLNGLHYDNRYAGIWPAMYQATKGTYLVDRIKQVIAEAEQTDKLALSCLVFLNGVFTFGPVNSYLTASVAFDFLKLLNGGSNPYDFDLHDVHRSLLRISTDFLDELSMPPGEQFGSAPEFLQLRHEVVERCMFNWIFGHPSVQKGQFLYNYFFFLDALFCGLESGSFRVTARSHLEIIRMSYYYMKSSYYSRKKRIGEIRERFEMYVEAKGMDWLGQRLERYLDIYREQLFYDARLETDFFLLVSKFRNESIFNHEEFRGDPVESLNRALSYSALAKNPWGLCQAAYEASKCDNFSLDHYAASKEGISDVSDIYFRAWRISNGDIKPRIAVECLIYFLEDEARARIVPFSQFVIWWRSSGMLSQREFWENRDRLSCICSIFTFLISRAEKRGRFSVSLVRVLISLCIEIYLYTEENDGIDFDSEFIRDDHFNRERYVVHAAVGSVLGRVRGLSSLKGPSYSNANSIEWSCINSVRDLEALGRDWLNAEIEWVH